jgi:hypothetical protein
MISARVSRFSDDAAPASSPPFRLPSVVDTAWNATGGFRKDGGGVLYQIAYTPG